MSLMQQIREMMGAQLSRLHKGEGGAVALMVLAALLIVFMISLVIYDTGKVARDKLEVQAAAETAAWSHTSIEARSMNTIAFANIGKKMVVGMNAYYEALIKGYVALSAIVVVLIVVCAIAAAFGADVCFSKMVEVGISLAEIWANEASDIGKFYGNTMKNYFKNDLKAFDNYQKYMTDITPWWAWMEGYLRGARNGAMAVGTFPVPKNMTSQLLPRLNLGSVSLPSASGLTDKLPARKVATNTSSSTSCSGFWCFLGGGTTTTTTTHDRSAGYRQICSRLWSDGDTVINMADYVFKTLLVDKSNWKWLIVPLAGFLALPFVQSSCNGFTNRFEDDAMPYEIPMPSGAADWQLGTSNLVFAYRPNTMLGRVDKDKYKFMSSDYERGGISSLNLSKDATGSWAMARAEISFQDIQHNARPDLWHTNWSARMRPVAIGTEWNSLGSGVSIGSAAMDALPYLAAGSMLSSITAPVEGGGSAGMNFDQMFGDMLNDGLRLIMSTDALKQSRSTGLAR